MDTLYNQVNPIVRIEESKLLRSEQFQQLMACDSFVEVADVLSGTVYGEHVKKSDFQSNYDKYLTDEQACVFKKFYPITPNQDVLDLYSMRNTYHNLKLMTKAQYTDQDFSEYFVDDGHYTLDTIKSAVVNQKSTELNGMFMESILAARAYVDEFNDIAGLDVIFDRYFLQHQLKSAESLSQPEIMEEVKAFVDLTNISTTFRCILQQRSHNFMQAVLSGEGFIQQNELLKYSNDTVGAFFDFLRRTPYALVIEDISDEDAWPLFEKYKDNYLTRMYRTAKLQAFGPMPLVGLIHGKAIEVKNLRLIFAGILLDVPKESIQERMRETYEL